MLRGSASPRLFLEVSAKSPSKVLQEICFNAKEKIQNM